MHDFDFDLTLGSKSIDLNVIFIIIVDDFNFWEINKSILTWYESLLSMILTLI